MVRGLRVTVGRQRVCRVCGGRRGARVTRGGATLHRRDLDTAYAQLVTFHVGPILTNENKINVTIKHKTSLSFYRKKFYYLRTLNKQTLPLTLKTYITAFQIGFTNPQIPYLI